MVSEVSVLSPLPTNIFHLPNDVMAKIFDEFVKLMGIDKKYVRFAEVCKWFHAIQYTYDPNPTAKAYRIIVPALEQPVGTINAAFNQYQSALTAERATGQIIPLKELIEKNVNQLYKTLIKIARKQKISLFSAEFRAYHEAVQLMLEANLERARKDKDGLPQDRELYYHRHMLQLRGLYFSEMVKAYADQHLEKITPDSFIEQCNLLISVAKSQFSKSKTELYLRCLLTSTSEKLRKLDNRIAKFAKAPNHSSHFLKARKVIRKRLEAKKLELELKYYELLGKDGLEEKIKVFSVQIEQLRIQVQNAGEDDLSKLSTDLEEKTREYNALLSKFVGIGEPGFKNGKICVISGPLFEVNAQLTSENLDLAARAEINKMAAFYRELRKSIREANSEHRSEALHRIICG